MKIICPKCGVERKTSPGRAAKRTGVCRACFLSTSATVTVTCSNCGESRKVRPTKQCQYPTGQCRKCYDGLRIAKRIEVVCPRCGNIRLMPQSTAAQYSTGYCAGCEKIYDHQIPDTHEAGYVVGAMLGDGYLASRNQHRADTGGSSRTFAVRLDVKNEAFARRFAASLEVCTNHKPWIGECDRQYKANPLIGMRAGTTHRFRVLLGNREWYEKLVPFKKGKQYQLLADFGLEFTAGFVQGFLDAEGYVNRRYVDFANKEYALLEVVERCLWKLGYHRTRIYGPYMRGVYHLRLTGSDFKKTV